MRQSVDFIEVRWDEERRLERSDSQCYV